MSNRHSPLGAPRVLMRAVAEKCEAGSRDLQHRRCPHPGSFFVTRAMCGAVGSIRSPPCFQTPWPDKVDARKRPYGEPTLRGRAPRLANRAASMPMRTATRPLTNTPYPRAAPLAIRPPCPALEPGQARPTGSLTRQQNRYSSSSSPQARLRRRPPRPKRQLALGLLRRCALQVRQYLRNELHDRGLLVAQGQNSTSRNPRLHRPGLATERDADGGPANTARRAPGGRAARRNIPRMTCVKCWSAPIA